MDALDGASRYLPLVIPVHLRTQDKFKKFGLIGKLENNPATHFVPPMGYIEFLNLVSNAAFVITDSGGIQEETTYLNIPCMALRNTTEGPITVSQGTNRLIRPEDLLSATEQVISGAWPTGICPELYGMAIRQVAFYAASRATGTGTRKTA